jgi:crotonobetainyl-CoA:carnitine CoA-transferase CaiB-like acyl-CoA transferase
MSDLEALLDAARLRLPDGCRIGTSDLSEAKHNIGLSGADPVYPTAFPIGEAAAAALAGGGAAAARLFALRGGPTQQIRVDVRAAAASLLGFVFQSIEGAGPSSPLLDRAERPATAIYKTGDDRFVHLHGGFPHLLAGTLELLDCANDSSHLAKAVANWKASDLEAALADRNLCGAMIRSPEEWADHPQGRALAPLAAIEIEQIGDAPAESLPDGPRPLSGIRNLDLTRVLAGPASGRTLAQYGADVLRISSPELPSIEPFVVETGHGKRSAHLDLRQPLDLEKLRALAGDADIVTDGYRNGGLAAKGLAAEDLAALRPGIVVVSLSCYGDVGPWANRRGWEQLAQSASGIAHLVGGDGPPRILPAAATDYTTGYLAAWGAMEALHRRATVGGSWLVRVSLCQTAAWLLRLGAVHDPGAAQNFGDVADLQETSVTPYGKLRHLRPAVQLSATPTAWERPTVPLGHDAPAWPVSNPSV